jgi:hypothetical protein
VRATLVMTMTPTGTSRSAPTAVGRLWWWIRPRRGARVQARDKGAVHPLCLLLLPPPLPIRSTAGEPLLLCIPAPTRRILHPEAGAAAAAAASRARTAATNPSTCERARKEMQSSSSSGHAGGGTTTMRNGPPPPDAGAGRDPPSKVGLEFSVSHPLSRRWCRSRAGSCGSTCARRAVANPGVWMTCRARSWCRGLVPESSPLLPSPRPPGCWEERWTER